MRGEPTLVDNGVVGVIVGVVLLSDDAPGGVRMTLCLLLLLD